MKHPVPISLSALSSSWYLCLYKFVPSCSLLRRNAAPTSLLPNIHEKIIQMGCLQLLCISIVSLSGCGTSRHLNRQLTSTTYVFENSKIEEKFLHTGMAAYAFCRADKLLNQTMDPLGPNMAFSLPQTLFFIGPFNILQDYSP